MRATKITVERRRDNTITVHIIAALTKSATGNCMKKVRNLPAPIKVHAHHWDGFFARFIKENPGVNVCYA